MNYFYSFFSPFTQIQPNLFTALTHSHQQSLPTTIIISNFQTNPEPAKKSEVIDLYLQTHASSSEASFLLQSKEVVKHESKPIRKEILHKRDESFGWRNQNKDRNMLSSILKGYVHYVLHNRGMIKLIERLSKKFHLENGVSMFYQFMTQTFPPKKSYIGIKFIQDAMKRGHQDREMRYIMGVTLRVYLKQIYALTLCQGKPLKKRVRLSLLKKSRTISSLLFQE